MTPILNIKKEKQLAKVIEVQICEIAPNPYQPRREFSQNELLTLAASIKSDGIIQPLTVRKVGSGYELVAGERRLRAAMLAGYEAVPCIVIEATDRNSALLALVENVQRQDLGFFDEANAIARLIEIYGMTQEDAAFRLGYAQSTLANKLRLLKLGLDERKLILEGNLTERHARAFLKLDNPEERLQAINQAIKLHLNVERTEHMIENMLEKERYRRNIKRGAVIFKDLRLFTNTINKAVETMQIAGVDVNVDKKESEEFIDYHIRIPLLK